MNIYTYIHNIYICVWHLVPLPIVLEPAGRVWGQHVYIHIYIHIELCIYIYICIYEYIYIYTYIYVCVAPCSTAHSPGAGRASLGPARVYTYIYTHRVVCVYIYMNIYTYIHLYMCVWHLVPLPIVLEPAGRVWGQHVPRRGQDVLEVRVGHREGAARALQHRAAVEVAREELRLKREKRNRSGLTRYIYIYVYIYIHTYIHTYIYIES